MRISLSFNAQVGSDHSRAPTKPNLWATLPSTRKPITIRTSLSAKVVILRRAIERAADWPSVLSRRQSRSNSHADHCNRQKENREVETECFLGRASLKNSSARSRALRKPSHLSVPLSASRFTADCAVSSFDDMQFASVGFCS